MYPLTVLRATTTLVAALVICTLAPAASAQLSPRAEHARLMRSAQLAFDAGNYSVALKRYQAADRVKPDALSMSGIARSYAWMRSCRRAVPMLHEVQALLGSARVHASEMAQVRAALEFCNRLNRDAELSRQKQYESDSETATMFYIAGGATAGVGVVGITAGALLMMDKDSQVGGIIVLTLGFSALFTGGGLAIRGLVVDPDGPFAGDIARTRTKPNGVLVAWTGHF